MKITINQATKSGNFLEDFTSYSRITDYLQDVLDGFKYPEKSNLNVLPFDLAFKDIKTNDFHWITQGGFPVKNASENIIRLRHQGTQFDSFAAPNLLIEANSTRKQCFIGWEV